MRRFPWWFAAAAPAALALLMAPGPLGAQVPKVQPSASVDLAALTDGEVRVAVEPLVVGRVAYGVSLARWWGGGVTYAVTPLEATSQLVVPGATNPLHPAREYMADLSVRVYPVPYASGPSKGRFSAYLGGFVGYHRRENDAAGLQPCPLVIACPLMGSPSIPCQSPCPPAASVRTVQSGVEPGAELGVRVMPLADLFLEVGGRARLITFGDPTGRFQEGQIDSRFTLTVGVEW